MPKISQIAGAAAPITGAETVVLNQNGSTYTASLSDIGSYNNTALASLSAEWDSVYTSYQSASASYATLTDGRLDASVIPDELDVRLSVLKDTRLNLREATPGNGELVIDSNTNEILVGDGTGKVFRGYQTSPLTFITTSSGAVSAYPYTAIPASWQIGNSNLAGLALGSSIISIGESAFQSAGFVGSLIIPDSVTHIDTYTFYACQFTGSLVIPDSVVSIGDNAFQDCNAFDGTLTLSKSLTSINDSTFSNTSFSGSLVIPDSVTNIGDNAFNSCTIFTGSLVIPDSITSIGSYAFGGCSSLTSITIGNSVTSIGSGAFMDCISLTSITIGNSVTSIGDDAFRNLADLTTINIYAVTAPSLGSNAFYFTPAPINIHVPVGATGYSGGEWDDHTIIANL